MLPSSGLGTAVFAVPVDKIVAQHVGPAFFPVTVTTMDWENVRIHSIQLCSERRGAVSVLAKGDAGNNRSSKCDQGSHEVTVLLRGDV
jgi:hypothetical protein